MHVNDILTAMRQRMFTPELTNSLLAAYWKELEEEEEDEIEFQRSHRILEEKLTPVQKDILRDMEVLCAKNVDYALEFAFHRGVYISFEQLFEKHGEAPLHGTGLLQNSPQPGNANAVSICQHQRSIQPVRLPLGRAVGKGMAGARHHHLLRLG